MEGGGIFKGPMTTAAAIDRLLHRSTIPEPENGAAGAKQAHSRRHVRNGNEDKRVDERRRTAGALQSRPMCGARDIRRVPDEVYAVMPVPSARAIERILVAGGPIRGRAGRYDSEGGMVGIKYG